MASVESFLSSIENEVSRNDCRTLVELIAATGEPPECGGGSIVEFVGVGFIVIGAAVLLCVR